MLIVVAYDVADDRRRNRIGNVLQDFGTRAQYSVYECHLDDAQLQQLLTRLRNELDSAVDRVRVYRLCAGCARTIESMGPGPYAGETSVYVI